MGKVITVWGSPGSGKSIFCCILAKALTRDKRKAIIINADMNVPMLPVWLPEQIIQTNTSIGQVLSSVEIDTSLVASHVTVLKNYPFIGMMGYAAGENPLSYPEVKYAMVLQLIHAAAKLVDFVILDCSTSMTNVFTPAAIEAGDVVIQSCFHNRTSLGDATNRKLMRDFRLYMLIGGMPQAVASYLDTNNLEKVDSVKRSIITLYEDDFNKIDPTGNASKMFHQIPAQLTSNANRYLAWSATDGKRNSELAEIISEIKESMVVNMAYHANDPGAGMALHQAPDKYKMFVGDTGLFVTLAFWDKKFTDNTIYHKLLSDKLSADLGYVYENVIAQMLKATGHELYYYTFPTESGKHNYEVDFLIAEVDKVSPIEVKSSGYKAHASLDAFCRKFSARIKNKYLVYTKDMRKEEDILYLPAYMTMFL